ncbi:MAG: HAD hydrolase-like protein [Clostridia bacterium]|nr:HAD hydrolase-like protein [Clostridia bacterium]
MSIKAVLFDLDGTLLPMDQDVFIKAYFGGLTKRLAPRGYDPQKIVEAIWTGTKAMVMNTGEKTNEEVFWDCFVAIFGEKIRDEIPVFDAFYAEDFPKVQSACGFDARARLVIDAVKEKGLRTALATNPLFPSVATENRIAWAGLSVSDFEYFTVYENSRHCKPNLDYYRDVLDVLKLSPEECVMVGNDVGEDMIAETLGMRVFLLTDCLINKKNEDISRYAHGGFDELIDFIKGL